MFELRLYQTELSKFACKKLQELGIVYLAMEVRTGKSLTALECARLYGAKRVLFLTKKKAIASIEGDYALLNPGYELTVANNESLHKVEGEFDLLIMDEAHRLGGYPRPSKGAKDLRERFSHLPIILLSGTPTPEGFSAIFFQFWVSKRSPFPEPTFYKWAGNVHKPNYVNVKQRTFAHGIVNDYSDGIKDKILPVIEPYMVRFTQKDANFVVQLHEHFCHVPLAPICKTIADLLMTNGVVQGKTGTISAENPAALLQKVHQIHSGTIILDEVEGEPRQSVILSDAKARYIADTWPTEKLVIFYVFKHELQAIKSVLGDRVTTDLSEFQSTSKSIALQVVSGREGLNLSAGKLIVFYNIQHSATSYFQARDRLTTSTRKESHIYWLFSGIEEKIYKVVQDKKLYTTAHFKKDYPCLNQKFKPDSSNSMKKLATLSSK
jgi:Type III restriction enzyme, res subunit